MGWLQLPSVCGPGSEDEWQTCLGLAADLLCCQEPLVRCYPMLPSIVFHAPLPATM
jgi:hypothetical protein